MAGWEARALPTATFGYLPSPAQIKGKTATVGIPRVVHLQALNKDSLWQKTVLGNLIECHYQESQTNFLAPDLNDKMEILYFLPFDLIVISFVTALLATSPESSEKKSGLIFTF